MDEEIRQASVQGHARRIRRRQAARTIQRGFRNFLYRRQQSAIPALREAHELREGRRTLTSTLGQTHTGQSILETPGLLNDMRFTRTTGAAPRYTADREGSGGTMELGSVESYGGRGFDEGQQEREYSASLHHETIHRRHHLQDDTAYRSRLRQPGEHGGWEKLEEQYTIEGTQHYNPGNALEPDVTENEVREELGLGPRFSHQGTHEDLPNRMNAQEFEAHRRQTYGGSTSFLLSETSGGFNVPKGLFQNRKGPGGSRKK